MSDHRFNRGSKVVVSKGGPCGADPKRATVRKLGTVVTLNPSGSYGIRLDDGRIVEAQGYDVSAFYETDRYTGREV